MRKHFIGIVLILWVGAIFGMAQPTQLQLTSQVNNGAALQDSSAEMPGKYNLASKPGELLRHPPAIENVSDKPNTVEVSLVAEPDRLSLLPGKLTDVYAYNGMVPGPTLEVTEGDKVTIRFKNNLPEETTVHWHGIKLPFAADGSPLHAVAPGEEYVYEYTILPGSAGTYWYHPHPHHRTAWQVGMGLYGAMIVHPKEDPLPNSISSKLILLSDNRFTEEGELDFPDPGTRQARMDEMNGREGDVLFVNDQIMPTIDIRKGETQRWRIINASGARIYRLALEGHTFWHIGSDGGLFEKPVEKQEIILSNGERAEILVQGTGQKDAEYVFQTLPYDRYMPHTRPKDWSETKDVLRVSYSKEKTTKLAQIPKTLRFVPPIDTVEATGTQTMLLSQGLINSKKMDLDRVDVTVPYGATEIWEVENLVGMDHPFHLHGFQFQLISRNGQPVTFRRWEDTINLPKREKARFIVHYDTYPGKWMYHCHILDHEDDGMMGILEVLQPNQQSTKMETQ